MFRKHIYKNHSIYTERCWQYGYEDETIRQLVICVVYSFIWDLHDLQHDTINMQVYMRFRPSLTGDDSGMSCLLIQPEVKSTDNWSQSN